MIEMRAAIPTPPAMLLETNPPLVGEEDAGDEEPDDPDEDVEVGACPVAAAWN